MLSPCLYFLLQNLYPSSALSFLQCLSQVGDLTVILFQSGHYHPNSCEGKARLKVFSPLFNVYLKDAFPLSFFFFLLFPFHRMQS